MENAFKKSFVTCGVHSKHISNFFLNSWLTESLVVISSDPPF